ncbi:paternally-expressed gene 3 protein isoform X1 [Saccopteryx leptura]|uniref:paternally-expressed gene 3 protein isoform X1 n=1 Tax=Saccopteryx leptura TaxID=249018 RepID=UPI00339BEEC8
MLPPKCLYTSTPKKYWAPNLYELDSDLTKESDAIVANAAAADSEFFHQRFRNFIYVEFVGPRKTLIKLRNLCLDWLQPETHTKEEIVELLVLEQYLTILPERIKPWVRANRPQSCEKLVTLLESYKEMYEPEDNGSDVLSEDSLSLKGAESPPPRSVYICRDRDWYQYWDRDRDWDCDRDWAWDRDRDRAWDRDWDWDRARDRDWDWDWDRDRRRDRDWVRDRAWRRDWMRERDRRGRSRDLEFRERWPYSRSPRRRFPPRDLSLPLMDKTFARERGRRRRNLMMDYELRCQDTVTYQDFVDLTENRKAQNSIQDNMENYLKLLSLGVQLAEDDGHSHLTQGHSRSKRSAYPSTSRGLKAMPESKKSTHRRGICEEESSHGAIMEKFTKDVAPNSKSGRARELNDWSLRFPRRLDNDWKEVSFHKRESLIQDRGCEGNAFGGGGNSHHSNLVSKKKVLERKRHYQFDADSQGSSIHDQRSCPKKRPFECSDVGKAESMCSISAAPCAESQPLDFSEMPYVCDECGRAFGMISEFVEHQIMHTRVNLYEYGESFIHSVAVSEVRKSQARGRRLECKKCGETFPSGTALAEHQKVHSRESLSECKEEEEEEECEELFMPSPTYSELQKIYGKDKFYECKVCKETFLHSSALVEHQNTHGGDNRDGEQGEEASQPSPTFGKPQKTYAKEKMHEGQVCEETSVPSQSLKKWQKMYLKEKPLDFKEGGGAFQLSLPLGEPHKVNSRKSPCESQGSSKSVIHSVPRVESQKSHTITRPPEGEDGKAFTVDSNPDDNRKSPAQEKVCVRKPNERSVIHSLAWAAQKSHSAGGFTQPQAVAVSTIQSARATEHQKAHAGEKTSEGKETKRSVIHSVATFKVPKSRGGNPGDQKGEPSRYTLNLRDKQQKTPTRANPQDARKNGNYKDSVIRSVSCPEPPKSTTGEEDTTRDLKKDGQLSIPSANAREHQKARAKKKNIEQRNSETSVIHALRFGEPQTFRPREKLYECPECGESFVRSSDLTEHQKIHHRKKPSGTRIYEQSVIRSLASTEPQARDAPWPGVMRYAQQTAKTKNTEQPAQASYTQHQPAQTNYAEQSGVISHTQQPMQMSSSGQMAQMGHAEQPGQASYTQQPGGSSYADQATHTSYAQQLPPVQQECKDCGQRFATVEDLSTHQKIYAQEEFHGVKLSGDSVIQRVVGLGRPEQEEYEQQEPDKEAEQDNPEDTIYGCEDCGLGFAYRADLKDHQKVHSREYPLYTREYTCSVIHTHSVSEYLREATGEQVFECRACGDSFIHSSFLFEHQKVHEQDPFYGRRRYDEPFMQPWAVNPPRFLAPQKSPPLTGLFLQCHICGLDYIHGSVFNEHLALHMREGPQERGPGGGDDVVSPGLALAELQRSQAEEKQYECETCGESFLSQSDLKDHGKVHKKEEPYDYGAAFVHTSFLTDPPKRDSSFFECKDCGKSFVHNRVLTKHQTFHFEEEEAAAAQAVEANVLLPREVLRIQGSHAEAAQPEVEVGEPSGEAAEPDGEAAQPDQDEEEPDGAGVEDPEERAGEPEEGDADEPDGAGIEDPEEEGDQEEIQVEEPYYDCRECGGTFTSNSAYGEHLKTHARVIIFESGNVHGEGLHYPAHAGTSTGAADNRAEEDDKYFRCDVCGQVFGDRLSLARHQNTHTG